MVCAVLLLAFPCGVLQAPDSETASADSAPSLKLEVKMLAENLSATGRYPVLAVDGQQQLCVGWLEPGQAQGAMQFVLVKRSDTGWSPKTVLASGSGWLVNWADFPQYKEDVTGAAVLSWLAQSKAGYGVQMQYQTAGQGWGSFQSLHEDQDGVEHGFVSWVALGAGQFFATWLQSGAEGPPTALRAVTVDERGDLGAEWVLDDLVCDCCGTAAVRFDSGKVLVAYRNRNEKEERDIFVVRGVPGELQSWSPPVRVGLEGWRPKGCPVNGPALARKGNKVCLAYFTEVSHGFPQVKLLFSHNAGKRFGFARVVAGGKGCLGRVSVAFPETGPILVSWLQKEGEQAYWMVRAMPQRGAPGPPLRIAKASGGRKDGFLRLISTAEGVFAAWTDASGQGIHVAEVLLAEE